jgi:hypothetical protein
MRLPCTVAGKNVPPFRKRHEPFIFAGRRNLLVLFGIDFDTSNQAAGCWATWPGPDAGGRGVGGHEAAA